MMFEFEQYSVANSLSYCTTAVLKYESEYQDNKELCCVDASFQLQL